MSVTIERSKVKDLPIKQILIKLKKFDNDIEEVVKDLITFYYKNGRHRYSLISQFLIENAYNQDVLEGLLIRIDMIEDFLNSNTNYINECVKEFKYDNTKINLGEFEKSFRKLKDHIELEDYRNKALKSEQESFVRRQTQELQGAINASAQNFINKTEVLENKLNTGFISILGIFAAIIIAFFGGIYATVNIFSLIANPKISSWKIIFFGCLAGIIVFNIIFMFLYFLSKFVDKNLACRKNRLSESDLKWYKILFCDYPIVTWFNIVMLLIIITSGIIFRFHI
ncbi:hypothetical protein [uncultured Clostridium sp.]|jgi:hypothetical protein|uniref:hypothetical protein n=1 Tax=uncultured Clostridium sp. TaxID=59620 RepID=UPI002634B889|nr:hypothetical protein [uncultured Clostridium sp.]